MPSSAPAFDIDALQQALADDDEAGAREMISRAPRPPTDQTRAQARSAACVAAMRGLAGALEDLLPLAELSQSNFHANQALSEAAGSEEPGAFECVRLLLPLCDPVTLDAHAESPLCLAAAAGREDIAWLLLSRVDPQVVACHGWTPFLRAAASGHEGVARMLAPRSDVEATLWLRGDNALMLAARFGHSSLIPFLASLLEPRVVNKGGDTALMIAAEANDSASAAALAPLSDLGQTDRAGRTALGIAVDAALSGHCFACADLLASLSPLPAAQKAVSQLGPQNMPRALAVVERAALADAIAPAEPAAGSSSAQLPGRRAAPRAL